MKLCLFFGKLKAIKWHQFHLIVCNYIYESVDQEKFKFREKFWKHWNIIVIKSHEARWEHIKTKYK